MNFTFIPHTADAGFWVEADSKEGIICGAIKALFTLILGDSFDQLDCYADFEQVKSLSIAASEDALILHDCLEEFLFLFETRSLVPIEIFAVSLKVPYAKIKTRLRQLDCSRINDMVEVKAITYHELFFRQRCDGMWEAKVVVDL